MANSRTGVPALLALTLSATPAIAQHAPEAERPHVDAGIAASIGGRRAEAIAEFEAAIAIDPGASDAHFHLARERALEGDAERGIDSIRRAAESGFARVALLLVSDDIALLRRDPRFPAILERARANAHAEAAAKEAEREKEAESNRLELERSLEISRRSPVQWQDGPTQPVTGSAFSPNGELLLTWGDDGIVRAWNSWSGESVLEFGRHSRKGVAASFSRDGERVLVFDRACGRATLYDGLSGEVIARIGDDASIFEQAALAPEAGLVATRDHRGLVRVWESDGGQPVPGFSFDETLRASTIDFDPTGTRLLVACRDLAARVLDAATGAVRLAIGDAEHPVSEAFFTANGRRIVSRAAGVRIGVHSAELPGVTPLLWVEDHERATSIRSRVSPDGARLVTPAVTRGDAGTEIVLWDVDAGKPIGRLPAPNPLSEHMAFSPDGSRFAMGRFLGEWRLIDGRTGKPVKSHPDDKVSGIHFSPDSRTIAARTARYHSDVKIYDARSGEAIRTAARYENSIRTISFSPDSERVVSANNWAECQVTSARSEGAPVIVSGQIRETYALRLGGPKNLVLAAHVAAAGEARAATARLWSLTTGLPVRDHAGFDSEVVAGDFSPDGRRVLLAGDSLGGGEWLRILDVETGATVADLPDNLDCIDARFGAGGTRIVATCLDAQGPPQPGSARLWDASTGKLVARLPIWLAPMTTHSAFAVLSPNETRLAAAGARRKGAIDLFDGGTGAPLRALPGHEDTVRHLAFSPDGSLLVSTSWDKTAKLWDVETGALRADHRFEDVVWHAVFDPSGTKLATACRSGAATVFDIAGGSEPKKLPHSAALRVVRFGPDGRKLATGSENGSVTIFDTFGDWKRTSCEGHAAMVLEAQFTPDGRRLLTMAEDGTTRVWDVETGRLLLTRALYTGGNWLAFEPHGYYAASPAAADWARVVVRDREFPLSSYANVLESKEKVAASLAGAGVAAPSQLPSAPLLELVSPASGESAETSFRLEAIGHDDYGIETVTVLQDGDPLDSTAVAAALVESRGGRTVRLSLPLAFPAGRTSTTIVVRAENRRRVLSRPVTVHLRHAPPRRELYFLAIGVGDYDRDSMDLGSPAKDVNDLTELLVRQDGRMYDKVHVKALTDRDVSLGAVRRLRDDFLLRAKPEDTIVVFAAGHGVRTATNEYYFLTSGSQADDPYDGIAGKDLEDLVSWERLHARKRVLLLDTCHSGASVGTRGATPLFGPGDQARLDESVREGIYVIAASADDEFAREQEGNGIFTRALLDGLSGSADSDKNGYVEIEELKAYAGRQVHERSGGRQVPTFPKVEGGENFRLAKVAETLGRRDGEAGR